MLGILDYAYMIPFGHTQRVISQFCFPIREKKKNAGNLGAMSIFSLLKGGMCTKQVIRSCLLLKENERMTMRQHELDTKKWQGLGHQWDVVL